MGLTKCTKQERNDIMSATRQLLLLMGLVQPVPSLCSRASSFEGVFRERILGSNFVDGREAQVSSM